MTEHIRSFAVELEVRTEGTKREIEGIAVPYNRVQHIYGDLFEEFDYGAFDHQFNAMNRVIAALEHVQLGGVEVGKTIHLENTKEGLFWRSRIFKLPEGDRAIEFVREGARKQLSIGFRARKDRFYRAACRTVRGEDVGEQRVTVRHKADLFEVAIVRDGAYGEAATIGGIRSLVPYGEGPEFIREDQHNVDVEDITAEWEARRAHEDKVRREMLYLEATRQRARRLGINVDGE